MAALELTTVIGNISKSLFSVEKLITGFAYLLGLYFIVHSLTLLRRIAGKGRSGGGHEKVFVPVAYLLMGAALLYSPSMIQALANTAFGDGNVLQYSNYNAFNLYSAMGLLIQTAGLIWFVRGCVLLAHASEPGVQEGPKGLAFLVAGVFAVNFDNSVAMLNYILSHLVRLTISLSGTGG